VLKNETSGSRHGTLGLRHGTPGSFYRTLGSFAFHFLLVLQTGFFVVPDSFSALIYIPVLSYTIFLKCWISVPLF
jgi:hypothetical protein